jgi:tetratricopeptide (TPR) repeat protein
LILDYNAIATEVDKIRRIAYKGDYHKALKIIEDRTVDDFSFELDLEKLYLLIFHGEIEEAYTLLNELSNSSNFRNMKSREFICDCLWMLVSLFKGQISNAEPFIKRIENNLLDCTIDNYLYFWKGNYLAMKGIFYLVNHNFELALKCHYDAEKLLNIYFEKFFSAKFLLAHMHNNIGEMYRNLGKLNESLERLEKAKEIYCQNNIIMFNSELYSQLGATFAELGDNERAIKYYEESLNDPYLMNHPMYFSLCNFRLFYLHLLSNNEGKAIEIRTRIFNELENHPNEIFYKQTEKIMNAILLMRQKRRKPKTQAQIIVEELISKNNLWFDYQNISRILLIQLLLEEFADFEEDGILNEAKILLDQLKTQAKESDNPLLNGELAILESKISLLTKNIDKANDILQEAKKDAETMNFALLQNKIEAEIQQLEELVIKWQEIGSIESTIKQRLEQVQIQQYLQKMIKEYK